jgi:metal-responsive CopG/Arc/MetJ family transcriptional regulator
MAKPPPAAIHVDYILQKQYNICMNSKTINISLPTELVKLIDKQAKKDYTSRSDYIRSTLLQRVRIEEKAGLHPELIKISKKVISDYKEDLKNLSER